MILFYKSKQKYFVVFGGFLILLTLGGFNTSDYLKPKIAEYMKNNSKSNTYQEKYNTFIFSLIGFGTGTSFTTGGFLSMKIGPTDAALFGCFILSANISLAYFTIQSYLIIVILSYGFLAGIGIGIAYGVALGTPCTWFPKHKGLVLGIVLAGYELSAPIFTIILDFMLHRSTSGSIQYLPSSFLFLGCIYAVTQIIGSILLRNKQSATISSLNIHLSQNHLNVIPEPVFSEESAEIDARELQPHQLLKDFDFWVLWMTFFLNISCITMIAECSSKFPKSFQWPRYRWTDALTPFTTVTILCNCVGRILGGYLTEKFSYKAIMRTITIMVCILSIILCIIFRIKVHNIYVYCLLVGSLNFFNGSNFSVFPVMTIKLYGMKYFICNYGLLFTCCSVGAPVVDNIVSNIGDKNNSIILYLLGVVSGMSLLATCLTFMLRGRPVVLNGYMIIF